jgi:hypothetical protein
MNQAERLQRARLAYAEYLARTRRAHSFTTLMLFLYQYAGVDLRKAKDVVDALKPRAGQAAPGPGPGPAPAPAVHASPKKPPALDHLALNRELRKAAGAARGTVRLPVRARALGKRIPRGI